MKTTKKVAILATTLITFGSLVGGANGAVTINYNETTSGLWDVSVSGTIAFERLYQSLTDHTGESARLEFPDGFVPLRGGIRMAEDERRYRAGLLSTTTFEFLDGRGNIRYQLDPSDPFTEWFRTPPSEFVSNFSNRSTSSLFFLTPTNDGRVHVFYDAQSDGHTDPDVIVNVETLADNPSLVPEPSSSILLGLGALGILARRKRTS